MAGRYARLALPLVVVLGAAGGVSALEALPSWSSLYSSGYGQLILVKTGLFGLALAMAAWSRWRGIGWHRVSVLARAVPVEASVLAVILVVTAVLAGTGPPVKTQAATTLLGPAPLTGAVARAAGMAGQLTVAVAAGSGQFQVRVWGPDEAPADADLDIDAFYPGGKDIGLFPRECGKGCFAQSLTFPAGVIRLHVTVSSPGWVGGTWVGDLDWPPRADDPTLLAKAVAATAAEPSVVVRETTSSNSTTPSVTNDIAPMSGRHLMALEIYGGGGAADPDEDGSTGGITDVQPLTAGGPGVQAYLPGTPAWVTLWLDSHGRIARDRIVDLGHVIADTFTYPSSPHPPS